MAFNSLTYLAFLVAVAVLYWLLPARMRRALVIVASVAFYASWNVMFLWMPLCVAAVVFVCGKSIQANAVAGKRWLWAGIGSLLALLVVFKYSSFVIANLGHVGLTLKGASFSTVSVLAFPVGISFYTFEAIAYLVDVRQGRVKMPGFVDLCLFFFFWPNILSGPIVRARELMPQLKLDKAFEPRFVFEGADRIVWGLVQKNVIANVLGIWVDRGFEASPGVALSTVDGWFLAIAFGMQIYFDFAGYTNLAIGTARLIGVTLPENFRQPYHAASPADFWNRWHMTLSRWIRDYLFFPINAKWKGAPLPLYVSLIAVMALVGVWHGAGWGFVLWGAMHGVYLAAYRMYENLQGGSGGAKDSGISSAVWRIVTLVAVIVAWVPFRAPSVAKAGAILGAMFTRMTWRAEYGALFYAVTVLVAVFCAIEPLLTRALVELDDEFAGSGLSMFRVVVRPVAYLFGLTLFLLFDQSYSQFIYSQF
ncbi:MAG TPA: MBOAT family O-acyltransferase [Methylomirabilota bacterium]|nr:MBOAT family O-acyltransferase [Methylomirabilota bacterium]